MAKHYVYQIPKSERDLASRSVFYSLSDAFTAADARQAFSNRLYKEVAVLEVLDYNEVKNMVNNDRGNSKLIRTGALRNINVGDIILNNDNGLYVIVSSTGFDRIKLPARPRL